MHSFVGREFDSVTEHPFFANLIAVKPPNGPAQFDARSARKLLLLDARKRQLGALEQL